MLKIHISVISSNTDKKVAVSDTDTIGSIIKEHLPAEASVPDTEEDLECYHNDNLQELPKNKDLKSLCINDGDKLIFSRCKKIHVTVYYAGHEFQAHYPPNIKAAKVKKDACHHFHITSDDEIASLNLYKHNTRDLVASNTFLGQLSSYPSCGIKFDLSKGKLIQG